MAMNNLIARLEAATGPDRELDAEIMFDLYAKPVGRKDDGGPVGYLWPEDNPSWNFGIRFPGKDRDWFKETRKRIDGETLLIERDGALVLMNSLRIPKLTASLDAAMSLVPEGYSIETMDSGASDFTRARIWDWRRPPPAADPGNEWRAEGNRPLPINICIAALRARASDGGR